MEKPAETVLITGASSGIGRELGLVFAAEGSSLVLVARNEDKLNALAVECRRLHGVEVRVVPGNLSDPETPQRIHRELVAAGVHVDVLVNNAGFGALGYFAELDVQRQTSMVQVNIAALVHLARLFLPAMLKRGRGGVLNVGSTAGFQPGPHMAVYFASKAFVISFTEALAEEVSGTGVTVTCLAPGPTKTSFGEDSGMGDAEYFKKNAMDVAVVAGAAHRGFRSGKVLVVPGMLNKLGVFSTRLAPRFVLRKLLARMNTKGTKES